MPTVELKENEHFFIEVIRQFDFLRHYGYDYGPYIIFFREINISFDNKRIKRSVNVCWTDRQELEIIISKIGIWTSFYKAGASFKVSDLYKKYQSDKLNQKITTKNYVELIKENSIFIQKKLLPIIKGEEWI